MRFAIHLLASVAGFAISAPAFAQFVPGPNPITGTVGAQALSGGTGTIAAGGAIKVNSGGGAALAITGIATLINNGTVQTLGSGRAIDSNALSTLDVTNTGLIGAVGSDAFRVNTGASSVTLTNSGIIQVTAGGQAIDWAAIVTGANKLTNEATGVITAVGEDAVRPGQNGVIANAGTISATPTGTTDPSGSDGIDLRTGKTVSVTNSGIISGRHGIATDGANAGPSSLTLVNKAGGVVQAVNGSGVNIDGVSAAVTATITNEAGATIKGGVLAAATNGDGDGIDVDGVLTLTNSGDVLGLGARGTGNNAEGVAAGGGSIVNTATGRIIGSTLAADAPNSQAGTAGHGILIDNSDGGSAVAATTIDNAGLIEGRNGAAVRIVGTFADSIANTAGGVLRATSAEAALRTGGGNDSVANAGTIANLGSGAALDLEDGDDTLRLFGGATVAGDMDGGAGTDSLLFDLTGGDMAYDGRILNFELVTLQGGTLTLATTEAYDAATSVFGGTLRFVGDRSGDAGFLALVADATVNGHSAGFSFDGTYTSLTQVPEPGTFVLFAAGLAGIAGFRRRRAA